MPQKFKELAEKALALPIDSEDRLRGCIDKIFQKVGVEEEGERERERERAKPLLYIILGTGRA